MAFCKEFNARTQGIKVRWRVAAKNLSRKCSRCRAMCLLSRQEDVPLPVLVTAYKDKSFEFVRRICRRCCAAVAFPDQALCAAHYNRLSRIRPPRILSRRRRVRCY
jgi:hypothetical protein